MTRMTKILTAALMSTSLVAAPALAGSLSVDTGASIGAKSGSSGGSAGTSIGIGADTTDGGAKLGLNTAANATTGTQAGASQGEILSAISANAGAASEIQTITDARALTVVNVGSTADASLAEIDQAVKENQAAILALRTSIQANADVWNKLEAKGVQLASVVAAKTSTDDSLTVFVR